MNLYEIFKKKANPKNDPKIKIDKETFKVFNELCIVDINNIIDKNYILANEIMCNRRAILSLDNHIYKLLSDKEIK